MRNLMAENKAREIIEQYDFEQIVPIDLMKIAVNTGIEVKNAVFKSTNISGLLYKESGKTTIFVNSTDINTRKRFTIAHELGHFFLHLNLSNEDALLVEYRTSNNSGDKDKENEANCFAAALLMDEVLVKSLWNDLKSVQSIAEIFQVSFEAMSYRLNNLGLI